MIIIPELKTVLILVPRTGSGSLRRAVKAAFPEAMQIYRHMEADGVPAGYDRWRRVGILRDPLERLWSLYKYCQAAKLPTHRPYDAEDMAWVRTMRGSTDRPFDDWLINNEVVFHQPHDRLPGGPFRAHHNVRHAVPENRKSQYLYLRPDLGTEIVRFEDMPMWADRHGLELGSTNVTARSMPPPLSDAAGDHMERFFAWDYAARRAIIENRMIPLSQERLVA